MRKYLYYILIINLFIISLIGKGTAAKVGSVNGNQTPNTVPKADTKGSNTGSGVSRSQAISALRTAGRQRSTVTPYSNGTRQNYLNYTRGMKYYQLANQAYAQVCKGNRRYTFTMVAGYARNAYNCFISVVKTYTLKQVESVQTRALNEKKYANRRYSKSRTEKNRNYYDLGNRNFGNGMRKYKKTGYTDYAQAIKFFELAIRYFKYVR